MRTQRSKGMWSSVARRPALALAVGRPAGRRPGGGGPGGSPGGRRLHGRRPRQSDLHPDATDAGYIILPDGNTMFMWGYLGGGRSPSSTPARCSA